jgi:NhaP-type Na+/H+ or K+/H+ antiporter
VVALILFAAMLLVASALSGIAGRSVLSTALLFLAAGAIAGIGGLDLLHVEPRDDGVRLLTEVALFSVLFTDGMKTGARDLRQAWRLPGRALLIGMPITFGLMVPLAHFLGGLPWTEATLVAAALSPTDPVLASAIVGREEVPWRVRHLLNVESGLNDGLALPVVVVMISVIAEHAVDPVELAARLAGGLVLGAGLPFLAGRFLRALPGGISARYEALAPVAVGVLLYAIANESGANPFLAAFAGGMAVASFTPGLSEAFADFGELTTELLKLAALLVLGALLTFGLVGDVGVAGVAFAVLVLTVARGLAIVVAVGGAGLDKKELATIAWFGPKGFASVVYALLIFGTHGPDASHIFALIAVTVALSIVAHSSTDVAVARWFAGDDP